MLREKQGEAGEEAGGALAGPGLHGLVVKVSLAKEGVGAVLDGVDLENPVFAELLAGGTKQGQQLRGEGADYDEAVSLMAIITISL